MSGGKISGERWEFKVMQVSPVVKASGTKRTSGWSIVYAGGEGEEDW